MNSEQPLSTEMTVPTDQFNAGLKSAQAAVDDLAARFQKHEEAVNELVLNGDGTQTVVDGEVVTVGDGTQTVVDGDSIGEPKPPRKSKSRRPRSGLVPMKAFTVPRNSKCPCGSGKKYKHCCIAPVPIPNLEVKKPGTPTPGPGQSTRPSHSTS